MSAHPAGPGAVSSAGTSPRPVATEPDAGPPRRGPWFELVGGGVVLAVIAVAGLALYRHLSTPDLPVLPISWSRGHAPTSLAPLMGRPLLTEWQVNPLALVVLGSVAALYLAGAASVPRRGRGRWPWQRTGYFLAGLGVCALATNSSIAVYDMALFSAHMVGHLMLVMLGPILLCAGQPFNLLVAATADPWHARVVRALRGPVATVVFFPPVVLATYAAVIVCSHLTGVMNTIMLNPWAGQLEHLVYVVVGVQFFTLITGGDPPIRWQLTTPARWVLLAISMAVDTFTGVILLMYVRPMAMTHVPGLDVNAYTDTQTGGAIMWVGGDGLMAAVMIILVVGWLRSPELRARDRTGFIERARRATFTGHTGVPTPEVAGGIEFDEDDERLASYNRWLASIDERSRRPSPARRQR